MEETIKSTSGRKYSLYPMGNEDVTIVFDWEFDKPDEERNTHIVYYFFGDCNDWNLVDVLDDYENMDRNEFQIKYGMK